MTLDPSEFCRWCSSFGSDVMQAVQDILVLSGQTVYPVLKGVIDIAVAMVPASGASVKVGKDVAKKSKEYSTLNSGSGVGKAIGNMTFCRNWVRLAGLSGAAAVGLGAYGAHVIMINENIPEDQKHSFRTANMYHFIGTFGLVASSLARHPLLSGVLMAVGTSVFCGACYYHGLTGDPSVKKFAPYGGTTLIAAWFSLVL